MLPKIGDKVKFNPDFLIWHRDCFEGLEHWIGQDFIFKVIDVKPGNHIILNIDIFNDKAKQIERRDGIYLGRDGIFTSYGYPIFDLAMSGGLTTPTYGTYCSCNSPLIVQSGFGMLIFNVCKICRLEHQ